MARADRFGNHSSRSNKAQSAGNIKFLKQQGVRAESARLARVGKVFAQRAWPEDFRRQGLGENPVDPLAFMKSMPKVVKANEVST